MPLRIAKVRLSLSFLLNLLSTCTADAPVTFPKTYAPLRVGSNDRWLNTISCLLVNCHTCR